ncbi:uncharacterized protein LOC109832764 [Asparagus officinalis]|uniref:uncharacterized protein LOC109832764 n=1 Tax=Asparagus officinalis TaxID=4686 RepID=UPI00098E541D|nr:uncharacterized protein LOC109832764 [Asparagus officinalis]
MIPTTDKVALIRECILAAQSRRKSYTDQRRQPLEFQVVDFVMLSVSLMKGVQRFSRRGKLTPRYIDPFKIVERIGSVSYLLDLPTSMSSVHDVIYILMLEKYLHDEEQQRVLGAPDIKLNDDLCVIEIPICILANEDKKLKNKVIHLIKVQWNWKGAENASWERDEDMFRDYPHLFE